MSADCDALSIFFTRDFVSANGGPNLDAFAFFERDARHVFTLPPAAAQSITRPCCKPLSRSTTRPSSIGKRFCVASSTSAIEWLAEAVLLEAHVLLQNPALTIGQIADTLHFADHSTFGRFFRNNTGVSPASYRQRCVQV